MNCSMKENWLIMCFKYKSNHVKKKKQSIHKIPPKVKHTTASFFCFGPAVPAKRFKGLRHC